MTTIVRDVRIATGHDVLAADLRIEGAAIAAIGEIGTVVLTGATEIDASGRLVVPGFVDAHLHLDKSRLLGGLDAEASSPAEAMAITRAAKAAFTLDDVYDRAEQTLRRCIAQGTMRIRTQVEVDPVAGLCGLEAIVALRRAYEWAVDIEICAFSQDGLSGPEDLALLADAVEGGATVVGGAPYADRDPARHIDEIFDLARAFDVDVDFHLDLAEGGEGMWLDRVCERTEAFGYEGRVAVGHATQMSYLPEDRYLAACGRIAQAGVAVTVMPSTDLFLMGRVASCAKPRGVLELQVLRELGVPCAVATNNICNAFTPFGDGSLLRMANLYANVSHVASRRGLAECLGYVTSEAARVIGADDYGIRVGGPADLVLLDTEEPWSAVSELPDVLWGMKGGRMTFTRERARLHDEGARRDDAAIRTGH